jgi:hypothetical protein
MANFDELTDLLNLFSSEDRPALEQILERNAVGTTQLRSQNLVYRGMVENDIAAQAKLTAALSSPAPAAAAAATSTPAPTSSASASLTLSDIESLLDSRIKPLAERIDPAVFDQHIESLIAKQAANLRPSIIGEAAAIADNLNIIRYSHRQEFGKELDREDFTKFYTDNAGKFKDLSAAHDAYVNEARITARIQKGIDEGLANKATNNVPGSSVNMATSETPFASMVRANPSYKAQNGEARGEVMGQAERALRALRQQHGY